MTFARLLTPCLLWIWWPLSIAVGAPSEDTEKAEAPFGIDKRTLLTTSRVVGTPDPPAPFRVRRAYPKFSLKQPIYLEAEPGNEAYLVVQHLGSWSGPSKILRVKDDPEVEAADLLIESSALVYGLTFHPEYETNGYVYIFGNGRGFFGRQRANRISRYTIDRTAPFTCDPESEVAILEWKSGGHDGGDLEFGLDGMLYIAAGDGSAGSDRDNTGQDLSDLCASVLRIDVDHPDEGKQYSVPKDNPFWTHPAARPEVWAYGLRNPWRLTVDRNSGDVWVGVNGQDLWEQAQLVRRGENYGWPLTEGGQPFHPDRELGPTPIVKPTVEHPHSEARSLTGGVVYRGEKTPLLKDAYVYGDYSTGEMWGVRHDGERVTWHEKIASTTLQITGFALDREGELLVVDHGGGLYHLEPTAPAVVEGKFPRRLSETGLFTSVKDHQTHPGLIPYSVNASRWSDGATKERFMALPGTSQIKVGRRRGWKFPEGSVLLQTFSLELEQGKPASRRRIETRLLTLQADEWAGYSYRWNEEQTDATLVDATGAEQVFQVEASSTPQGKRQQTWRFPSRTECMGCHSRAVEYVLGLTTLQMNKEHDYGAVTDNQLRTLEHIGVLSSARSSRRRSASLVDPHDPTADLDARARSYLHANCHHCHVHEGGGNARFQLEFGGGGRSRRRGRRRGSQLVGATAQHGSFGLDDARLVAPGHPERSVLYFRMAKLGRGRMPYSGSALLDTAGLDLVYHWIEQLPREGSDEETPDPYRETLQQLTGAPANGDTPSQKSRDQQIEKLLGASSSAVLLLRALEKDDLPEALRQRVVSRAMAHPSEPVRDLFERFVPEDERIERLGTQFEPAMVLALPGDSERGQKVFFDAQGAQCQRCHRIGETGGLFGPELSAIGDKYNRAELLESLTNPSGRIDAEYAAYVVLTAGGDLHSGFVMRRDATEVVLRTAEDKEVRIAVDDVAQMAAQKTSLMPELLLRDMTAGQAADLVAFLASLKARKPPRDREPSGR